MAAPEDNENCYHVQNDPQRYKVENFVLISCGVIELSREVSLGVAEIPPPPPSPPPPPGEVGLITKLASK